MTKATTKHNNKPAADSAAYDHARGFMVRVPLQPFRVLQDLLSSLHAAEFADDTGDRAGLDAALDDDLRTVADRVRALVADPIVREAIFIASPSLDERIAAWLDGEPSDERALVRSIVAYLARMTTRATPFGLFAGCSAGTLGGDTSSTRLPGVRESSRHTRLDFGFVTQVIRSLEQDEGVQPHLRFRPNSGLYRAGGRLRVAEARMRRGRVQYQRVAFDEDEALRAVLDAAANAAGGGATIAELAAVLTGDGDDVTVEEATEYVAELVDAQLLVSELGPPITGDEPVRPLVDRLRDIDGARLARECLADAQEAVESIDGDGMGVDTARYRDIADGLRKIDADIDPVRLFQVDLARAASGFVLGDDIAAEMVAAVDLLRRMAPSGYTGGEMTRFREAFVARYEDREVPLVEVLDEEIGIGYGPGPGIIAEGGPLLAGVAGRLSHRGGGGDASWEVADTHRLRLITDAIATGATEVRLGDDDIAALTNPSPPTLPDAIALGCAVLGRTADAVASGDFRLLVRNAYGPSGARMLGRFCHGDPAVDALVRRHIADEEALEPDAVFAEVVHLAEGRLGNVLARPVLRAYEIPFLGQSGAPSDTHLPLDDLLVSVQGDKVILRSRRLGRRVIPRLTSAHNFGASALAAYRFLGDLQEAGVQPGVGWSWGRLDRSPFVPRVVTGRLVLSRARWTLSNDDLRAVIEARTVADRFVAVQELRAARRLPRWVIVALADNELTMDLASGVGCDAFAHEARQRGSLVVLELLPGADDLCVEGPEGRFFHEIVVPMVRRRETAGATPHRHEQRSTTKAAATAAAAVDETFMPGSEWLTAKLYTGKGTSDAVLRELVAPVVAEASAAGLIDGWFFLRYADPEWHLRLRFHGTPSVVAGEVLPRLERAARSMLDDGRIWRLQLDTYRRETQRYGGPAGVLLAEQLFHADSDAVLAAMLRLPPEDDADDRWRVAIAGVDRLLADLGMDIAERQAAVRTWRNNLADEFGAQGASAKQWGGQLMRKERDQLTALLDGAQPAGPVADAVRAFDARSSVIASAIAPELRRLRESGALGHDIGKLAFSYSHMHVNRLLRASQRLQEVVVYDLLDRLYSSRLHRGRAA